jgi:hypothetical protein
MYPTCIIDSLLIISGKTSKTLNTENNIFLTIRPSNYVAWGSTLSLTGAYEKARKFDMVKRDSKWTLVFEDFKSNTFDVSRLSETTNFLQLNDRSCCAVKNQLNGNVN